MEAASAWIRDIFSLNGVSRNLIRHLRLDKLMFKSAEVPNWVVLIYERQQRFRPEVARQMITDLVKTCEEFGK